MVCCRWWWWWAVVLVTGLTWGTAAGARTSLRQVANDCESASCCGYTEGSVGCRFQGNRCRCPFLIPSPLTTRPYGYRIYPYFKRRRPSKHEDNDRR